MSKILMIDDDAHLLDLLQDCLEDEGHLVLKATEAKEAIKLFRDTKPELVIIDIIMPRVDGLELLKQFKSIGSDFKSILLSGLNDDQLKERAKEVGANLYLTKPIPVENFQKIINKILSH